MGARPVRGELNGRPDDHADGIGEDDEVQVVGHHRIRHHIDIKGPGHLAYQFADPGAAVLGLIAAEEGATDIAGGDEVGAGALVVDQEAAGEQWRCGKGW